jgi:methyl-accepting chemotaxis protein
MTAGSLKSTAASNADLSRQVAHDTQGAFDRFKSVAGATSEMSTSVDHIREQMVVSRRIAEQAVQQTLGTDQSIGALSQAATEIGNVVDLIDRIAQQTNLLALNATIEAARAGPAGRGFAVVAQEVKTLAAQTAQATQDVHRQIQAIQEATGVSVTAIKTISTTIGQISDIASTCSSAVDNQGQVTIEIADSVRRATHSADAVKASIVEMSRGAGETGEASSLLLSSAQQLADDSQRLKSEVQRFIATVRAA